MGMRRWLEKCMSSSFVPDVNTVNGNFTLCYLCPSFITPEVFTAPYGLFQAKNGNPFVYVQKVL